VAGSVVDVPVSFPTLTGQSIRITVADVRIENTPNYYSQTPIAMPIGIAEVGIPGLHAAPLPATIPSSCRDDLLTIDGAPVWISITGSTTTALDRQPLTVSLCGPDAGGLALGPGTHVLRSTLGQVSGFDIDQLALDSAPGGAAMPLSSPTSLAAPPVSPSPAVRVVSQTSTTIHLSVTGVSAGAGQPPVNLILGESINAGWQATVVGAGTLGDPVLIDGFANGWRLDLSTLGSAVHGGALSVVLQWRPQSRVNVALIISVLAILACLVLAIVPVRRRRRVGRHSRARTAAADGPDPESAGQPVATTNGPRLAVPFGAEAPRAPLWVALVTGPVTGGVAAVVATPLVGVAVGAVTVVVLLVPRLRVLLGVAAIAGVVAAGWYTAAHQAATHAPANGSWPLAFGTASQLAWAGVVFLGADGMVEAVLTRRARRRQADDVDGVDPPR
jgi:hypothetical protein